MKSTMLAVVGAAIAGGAAGCAHGLTGAGAAPRSHDRHGALRVASETRLLLAGPASDVHTRLDDRRPSWLYVVGAVDGDDRDCALATVRETPVVVEVGRPLQLPQGRELCVAVAGTTEVLWHARVEAKAPATTGVAVSPRAVALQ